MFFDRCPSCGRCREIRHPWVNWLSQEKRRGGQEGDAGKQVCSQGPPSSLLPHPQQPHPYGSTGPSGVEISFSESVRVFVLAHTYWFVRVYTDSLTYDANVQHVNENMGSVGWLKFY